ncbi:MAG: HAD-IIA family hydrolase [Acidimicrobiia bacterium]|nr:HAD-IIA family hydrolase [Acidimicrobiia bacterium]
MNLDAIETVVCDIDGVVLLGATAIPGAGQALEKIRGAGLEVLFITNNSTKTRATVADRIAEISGYATAPETIISSGWATGWHIAGKVNQAYVVGTEGLRSTLRETGVTLTDDWSDADAVVMGLDFDLTFRALVEATLAVQNGAAFYATNSDRSFPTPEGLYPGAGALVATVETATGVSAIPCGKPNDPMRQMLADFVDGDAMMVGDRPETDLALGKAEGWATALVLTGVTRTIDEVPPEYQPDLVVESIADLPSHLGV